ncbi:hypothetical protein BP6252_13282 [Coleophoma cylindrospora]|uniref:Uncharacterized protein n=1 Tax=Coleophoma cylindrospora TaxID=1849047 RepID=A0A3D8QAF3_9HELO|nr:hypothetical protein BP6252_13282 [Coleophoma cylindrospora]
MAKNPSFSFSSGSIALLCWVSLVTGVWADLYDNQLLGVNASWPSGANLQVQDGYDGNASDPTSLSPFRDGPPTVYLKATHDDVFPASYIEATNSSLLSSKYLVMLTLYNETDTSDEDYTNVQFVWIQDNMTASTPGGMISDNNTFVTLHNDTEPLMPYSTDFNLTDMVSSLRFDQTTWQLSVGVYQQTPELEAYLYPKPGEFANSDQYQSILYTRLYYMFSNLYYGTENPSKFWNSSSVSPWGRVYCYVPGVFDEAATAIPTASTSSSSASSSSPTATTSKGATNDATIKQSMYGCHSKRMIVLSAWIVSALSAGLFI